MFDIYEEDKKSSSRFILGKTGRRKLFVVGLNPSTASQNRSDNTIARVEKISQCGGYDGFVMVNLYPLRCTRPDELPESFAPALARENIDAVFRCAHGEHKPVFWAAWGETIQKRNYFVDLLGEFVKHASEIKVRWKHYEGVTCGGHPRHPSRLAYGGEFRNFDIHKYLEKFKK